MFDPQEQTKCACGLGGTTQYKFEGHLIQIGSARFLDAVASMDAEGVGTIPAHSIFKLIVAADSLSLSPLDDGWLCSPFHLAIV
jgi:hypothetical protein